MEEQLVENILNDDCLLSIFEDCNLKELTNVVRVSKQFERVAHRAFRRKYKCMHLSDFYYSMNTDMFHKVFIHFGHLIDEFDTISECYPWYSLFTQVRIISLIGRYCNNEDTPLKILRLNFFSSIDQHLNSLNGVFENLQILILSHVLLPCSIGGILNRLPNAREVVLNYCIPSRNLEQTAIIYQNLNMKKLHLRCRQDLNMLQILSNIDELYPNVTHLLFDILSGKNAELFGKNIHRIARLKELESLEISMMFMGTACLTTELIKNGIRLKVLRLNHITVTEETMSHIYKLTDLQEFCIFYLCAPDAYDIHNIVTHLGNLKILSVMTEDMTIEKLIKIVSIARNLVHGEFSIHTDSLWNEINYGRMLETVKRQNKGTRLVLTLHKRGIRADAVNETMFLWKQQPNPYFRLHRQYNKVKSIFNNDWSL